jgi:hypothetical protein
MVSYPNPWFQLRTGTPGVFLPVPVCPVCVPAPPGVFLPVRPRVPCVPCVSRLPPVSFYRYASVRAAPRADHLRNKHSLGTESGSASDAV